MLGCVWGAILRHREHASARSWHRTYASVPTAGSRFNSPPNRIIQLEQPSNPTGPLGLAVPPANRLKPVVSVAAVPPLRRKAGPPAHPPGSKTSWSSPVPTKPVVAPASRSTTVSLDLVPRSPSSDGDNLVPRSPVVTIMGHVDHGKTTLLDAFRSSNVVASEYGGITQHIGAFSVQMRSGQQVTFLDTPGHAAFTRMRARGAKITDIVVLVVAADDGIQPQTIEAIRHAQAANVPMIVAVNKVDRPHRPLDHLLEELAEHGVVAEALQGDIQVVPISALKKQNLEALEEAIVTLAELLQLRAENSGLVEGVILEARVVRGRGNVATVLLQRGTLRIGSVVVSGNCWAKVRSLMDDRGHTMSTAPPSSAIEIDGWKVLPSVGDRMLEAETEERAKSVVEYRQGIESEIRQLDEHELIRQRNERARDIYDSARTTTPKKRRQIREQMNSISYSAGLQDTPSADSVDGSLQNDLAQPFYLILKADVGGSIEAIRSLLDSLSEELGASARPIRWLHAAVGPVTESDVMLASASQGEVIAFNVKVDKACLSVARSENVKMRYFQIIYELADSVRKSLLGEDKETASAPPSKLVGEAEIMQVFNLSARAMPIAGCRIRSGIIPRGATVHILRNDQVIYDGPLTSLKRMKEDIESAKKDTECGMAFGRFGQFTTGDRVQAFQ